MPAPKIELLVDCHATIGESPTWAAAEQALYWIDVKQPALHRLDADGRRQEWGFDADLGAFALTEDGTGAVVALRTGLFRLCFAGGPLTPLAPAPFNTALFRFNEGICDARGRFWVGVMLDPLPGQEPPPGNPTAPLHRFTFASGLTPAPDRSDLHNGMAWSADGETLYLSHSNAGLIHRHPYDIEAGALGAPEPFVATHDGRSVPDGAAMDAEGCYWCAIHGAGVLRRYDPGGRMVSELPLPVSQPTMCAFTGPDLADLVVTSAANRLTPEQRRHQPHAGALFRLRPGVRGIPRPCIVR